MMKTLILLGVVFAVFISGCTKHGKSTKILAGPMLPMKQQREDLKRVAPAPATADKTEKAPAHAKAKKKAHQASNVKKTERHPASAHKAKHRKQQHRKAARKAHRTAHAKKRHTAAASDSDDHAAVGAPSDTVKE